MIMVILMTMMIMLTADWENEGDIYIAYSLSYNILKNQQKPSGNNGDIARKLQECRIQIWEKVISHIEQERNYIDVYKSVRTFLPAFIDLKLTGRILILILKNLSEK